MQMLPTARCKILPVLLVWLCQALIPAVAQQASNPPASQDEINRQLLQRLQELEDEVKQLRAQGSATAANPNPSPNAAPPQVASPPVVQAETSVQGHEHSMKLPGGIPVLKIQGFFDFNFGVGSISNPLIFPIINNGCGACGNPPTPPHTSFQAGELDLFITSKLSDSLSFLSELAIDPDTTNEYTIDVERYQLTYRGNRNFSAGVGRMHTAIGYYNTAYHHGTWFATAAGRPIMYLFEDSGGVLPMHLVGISFTGSVPHAEKLGLHWIAEVGNGVGSNSRIGQASVQNFYSDRNYKAVNLAAYIKPESLPGVQIGGSWYHDALYPTGLPQVMQNIESAYVVYLASSWEFLNEGVLLSNHLTGTPQPFRSTMAYTQAARKFGIYKPYFRYQYVRDNPLDPVNRLRGTYYGPSVGLRADFSEYAAFKLQFNHLYQSNQLAGNGLNAQVAFAF